MMSPLRSRSSAVALALSAAFLPDAQAGRELTGHEYTLRFPAAVSRFASYPDVAALGGAQVASEWSSSLNPASAAWPHPDRKFRHSFSGQFSTVHFAEGLRLDIFAEAPAIDAGAWGVFLPAAAQIRSNHATQRPGAGEAQGLGFAFEADYFQLQWGKMCGERWALGGLVSFTSSETRLDSQALDAEVARTRSETYTVRLGAVHQPLEKLRLGVVVEYAAAPARTRQLVGFDLFAAPVYQRTSDTTHQFLLRTGLTWEYAPGCDFYLDYHGGVFSDDSGDFWVHRFPVGLEQTLIRDILFGRIGATFDSRGSVVWTGGVGVSLGSRVSLDLAYQRGAFPEIRPEFGAADGFVTSIAVGF